MAYTPVTVTEDQLKVLDEAFDEVAVFKSKSERSPWLVVVRKPKPHEAIAYKSMASDPSKRMNANVSLVKAIAVLPDGKSPEWERQFERWPFFPDGLVDSPGFKDFVGLAVDEAEK